MMIVVPMIIQTLSFGYIYKHFLGENHKCYFVCGCIIIGCINGNAIGKTCNVTDEDIIMPTGGGH